MLLTILVIIVLFGMIGSGPWYPYSRGWGYGPSGLLGLVFIILVIYLIVGGAGTRGF